MVSFCVKKYEVKILSREKLKYNIESKKKPWTVDGWMGGWVEAKAGLRIAYSNQKLQKDGWQWL